MRVNILVFLSYCSNRQCLIVLTVIVSPSVFSVDLQLFFTLTVASVHACVHVVCVLV